VIEKKWLYVSNLDLLSRNGSTFFLLRINRLLLNSSMWIHPMPPQSL